MAIVGHSFLPCDLVAGHVVLDFINTVTARDQPDPSDWLRDYDALLQWATLADGFRGTDLAWLKRQARGQPAQARRALADARQSREAIHEVVAAMAAGLPPAPGKLSNLQSRWRTACGRAHLHAGDRLLVVRPTTASSGLRLVADVVVLDAVAFLETADRSRLRCCAGSHCGWHFLDTSKAGRRRWCDMATCGNVAKATRHQERLAKARME